MQIYEELVERGLIAQVTDEDGVRDLINNGKATFYIGFDPTADSLHVGHFMALCLMKRLQMAGNRPIALVGGGTGMIGDPSGRTDLRKMMTTEMIDHNCECFKKQLTGSETLTILNLSVISELCSRLIICFVQSATSRDLLVKRDSPSSSSTIC